jgi:hypothetical protein
MQTVEAKEAPVRPGKQASVRAAEWAVHELPHQVCLDAFAERRKQQALLECHVQ